MHGRNITLTFRQAIGIIRRAASSAARKKVGVVVGGTNSRATRRPPKTQGMDMPAARQFFYRAPSESSTDDSGVNPSEHERDAMIRAPP